MDKRPMNGIPIPPGELHETLTDLRSTLAMLAETVRTELRGYGALTADLHGEVTAPGQRLQAGAPTEAAVREPGLGVPRCGTRPPRALAALGGRPRAGAGAMNRPPPGDDLSAAAYAQEKTRVMAWIIAAEHAWEATHRSEARWQEAWRQDFQMGATAFDPARPGHRLVRRHWDDALDAQRASDVLDRAAREGVVPPEVLRQYRDAWTEWQAVTHDPTYLAPLRPTLATYAADEAMRQARQRHRERHTAPAALLFVWGQFLEVGRREVARQQLERRTGQAHRFGRAERIWGRLLERVVLAGEAFGRVQTREDEAVLMPWTRTLEPHRGRTVAVELDATPQVTRVLAEAPQRTPAPHHTPDGERGKSAG